MDKKTLYQNVRKAYRLVYEVQDSIVEIVEYIRARIRHEDYAGKQLFSAALAKRNNLDSEYDADKKIGEGMWSWDYFPTFMYMYFFVLPPMEDKNCHFSILQVMDDGFKDLPPNNSPPSTKNFNLPVDSESYLLFSFSIFKKRNERIWFDHNEIEPIDDEVIEIIRISEKIQDRESYIVGTADNCFIVMKRSIESIGNKDEAAEALQSFAKLILEKTGYQLLIEELQA